MLMLLAASAPVLAADKPVSKRVECTVEITPNYLWHLLALGNVWDKKDRPYFERYRDSVTAADLKFIHQKRDLIVWGNGKSSPFTSFLFFIPFSSAKTDTEYFSYLEEVNQAAKNGTWAALFQKYSPDLVAYADQIDASPDQIRDFSQLTGIIKSNYPAYQQRVWPEVKKILDRERSGIESFFSQTNRIEQWEKALHMQYPGNAFTVVLTFANSLDHLPSANNLSATRNNFGVSGNDIKGTLELILHEIGIFTFTPVREKLQSDVTLQTDFIQSRGVLYQAIESYIEKKKGDLFGHSAIWEGPLQGGGTFDFPFFYRYYRENEKTLSPEALIRGAVNAYVKTHKE
jgi:hypothetical protein